MSPQSLRVGYMLSPTPGSIQAGQLMLLGSATPAKGSRRSKSSSLKRTQASWVRLQVHICIQIHISICMCIYICLYVYIYIHICMYFAYTHIITVLNMRCIYIYATPPLRSMDFRLLGIGRLKGFSNSLISNAVSMKTHCTGY